LPKVTGEFREGVPRQLEMRFLANENFPGAACQRHRTGTPDRHPIGTPLRRWDRLVPLGAHPLAEVGPALI
jgi:hypothetical protein